MIEDKYIDDYAADAAAAIGQLQRAAKHNAALSQVTIAKAAETDRLTDENRRLRARVEELEASALAKLADAAHAARTAPAPKPIDPLHGWTIPAEMLAQVVEVTAHEVDGPSGYALMRLAKKLRGET